MIDRNKLVSGLHRRVWRYQKGNQNPYIEEKPTTKWHKEKVRKEKQRSTKHTYKTKDRLTRTPLPAPLVVSVVLISREWGKDREVFTTSGTYPWSFVTQIFHNGQPCHGGDHNIFEVMTSTLPKGNLGSVVSLLAATKSLIKSSQHNSFHNKKPHQNWMKN
jgi:hypothetical protein